MDVEVLTKPGLTATDSMIVLGLRDHTENDHQLRHTLNHLPATAGLQGILEELYKSDTLVDSSEKMVSINQTSALRASAQPNQHHEG